MKEKLHETRDRREAQALHEWLALANIPSRVEFEVTHYEVFVSARDLEGAEPEFRAWEQDWNR